MPRGSETNETPEVPQEGGEPTQEVKAQDEVKEQEVRRDQEVVEEPAAVVERERPVEESEEIEREVVEAVEAVEAAKAAADGGRETEDGDEVAARSSEEVSATPITLPDPPKDQGDEISATPITLPDPPKDQGDEISATPITLPDPPGDEVSATPITLPDPPKDQGDEVSATPITLPDPPKDQGDEVSATPITLPDPPRDQGDEVSATPITLPDPPKDRGDDVSATPITLPKEDPDGIKDPAGEVSATPINTPGGVDAIREPVVDQVVDGTTAPAAPEPHSVNPSIPPIEKDLPEGGQMEKGYEQQEDLQDIADGDLSSLIPEGKLTGPDGKESKDSKFGDGLGDIPGMGSRGKIDGSSEDPSGDQFAGEGMFKPGKGPGGGVVSDELEDEADVNAMIEAGASEAELAAKEKQLQEKALDNYEITKAIKSRNQPSPSPQKKDKEDPPKPKKTASESTPEEGGDTDRKPITQAELDTVLDETSGSHISNTDPDDMSGGEPDGRLKPEAAKKIKDAMDQVASIKHKQKKAGAEVITDPDQEDPEGGELGKKMDMDIDI